MMKGTQYPERTIDMDVQHRLKLFIGMIMHSTIPDIARVINDDVNRAKRV